jgi:hypothetical protein
MESNDDYALLKATEADTVKQIQVEILNISNERSERKKNISVDNSISCNNSHIQSFY